MDGTKGKGIDCQYKTFRGERERERERERECFKVDLQTCGRSVLLGDLLPDITTDDPLFTTIKGRAKGEGE